MPCSFAGSLSKSLFSSALCALLFCVALPVLLFTGEAAAGVIAAESGQSPWLGLTARELDEYTARMLAIDQGEFRGLVVIDVVRDGPADEAGIVRGDVLLSIDGKEIPGYEEFRSVLGGIDVGSTLKLLVDKGGRVKNVFVTLGSEQGFVGSGGEVSGGTKEITSPGDELRSYYWMKEAPQYDYVYSLALGALDLTPAKRRDASLLMSGYEKKMLRYSADIDIAEVELRELLDKEPVSLKEVHAKIVEIAAKRTELRYQRIKAHVEFKKLLTKEQQLLLKEFISERQGRARSVND